MKINKIIFIILLTYGCAILPGINKDPKEQSILKPEPEFYSINDIEINIIDINKLDSNEINNYNLSKVKELKYSINSINTNMHLVLLTLYQLI